MIFVDTAYWIALRVPRDTHHAEAARLLTEHGEEPLVTSNHVRGETWTFLRRKVGHRSAVSFLDSLEDSPRIRVVRVSEDHEVQALRWLRRHTEREYSFVDATSFMLMKAMRIRDALTFDEDFTAAGFRRLQPGQRGPTGSRARPARARSRRTAP